MEDLAGFLLAIVIDLRALVRGEEEERVARHLGIDHQRLESGDERIAPERRRVPGNSGRDDPPPLPEDVQGLEVRDGLVDDPVERLFAGLDARGGLRPAAVGGAGAAHALLVAPGRGRIGFLVAARIAPARLGHLGQGRRRPVAGLAGRVCGRAHRAGTEHVQGGDGVQLELDALVGPQVEAEAGPVRGELVRRAAGKRHFGAVHHAVPALVGEHHPVPGDARPEEGSARSPPRPAHLELVGEVAGKLVLDPVIDVADEEVGQREALDELVVHHLLAAQMEEVDRIREQPSEELRGDRQIDLRGVVGAALGREHHRGPARDREPQLAQEARVLEVRALVARAGGEDVAQPPRHREEVPSLEHQFLGAGGFGELRQVVVPEQLARRDGVQRRVGHVYPASTAVKASAAVCR